MDLPEPLRNQGPLFRSERNSSGTSLFRFPLKHFVFVIAFNPSFLPSSSLSFFQIGTSPLTVSIMYLHASKASFLCGAETAMATLTSPSDNFTFLKGHFSFEYAIISFIFFNAISSYASYSISLTLPASLKSLTVPRKITIPPELLSFTSSMRLLTSISASVILVSSIIFNRQEKRLYTYRRQILH